MCSVTGKGDLFVTSQSTEEWMREYALVISTIIPKDMPFLIIILQQVLEHLHSLRCDSRPTSWGNGTGRQRRSWEERIERRIVGHPSSEAGASDASINFIQSMSIMYRHDDAAWFDFDGHLGNTRGQSAIATGGLRG